MPCPPYQCAAEPGSVGVGGLWHGYCACMSRPVARVLGGVLVLLGLVWFLQGVNVLGGSSMSGVTLWVILGPIVAIVGVLLIVRSSRGPAE
jgi:hypothetical protein